MTKSKLKKSYCIMSFVFAVAVLIIALTLSMGQTRVYAADTSSDMITGLSNTDSSDGPVSYTHLDVYKRQYCECSEQDGGHSHGSE